MSRIQRLKNLLKNLFLAGCSVAVAAVIAEISLHFVIKPELAYQNMPQRVIKNFMSESLVTQYSLKKNYNGRFLMSAAVFDSVVRTNSLGWRDSEPDDRPKILVMGDSFVFGYGLSNGETVSDVLERLSGNKINFINLGFVAGGSPDSYVTYLRAHPELQKQKVILWIYSNDLNDMEGNDCMSSSGQIVSVSDPLCRSVKGRDSYIQDGELFTSRSFLTRLPSSVRLWLKMSYLIALVRDRISTEFQKGNIAAFPESIPPNLEQFKQEYAQSLIEFKKALNVLDYLSEDLFVVTAGHKDDPQRHPLYLWVDDYCQSNHIPYFHVPTLDNSNYWQRDAHLNQAGAREVAKEIYSHMPWSLGP